MADGFFYNMVDVAAFAAFRLYELCHPDWNTDKSEKRKIFIKELAFELAKKHMENRCKKPLKKTVQIAMDLIGFQPPKMTTAPLSFPAVNVINPFPISISISNFKMFPDLIPFMFLFIRQKIRNADVKHVRATAKPKITKQQPYATCV